MIIIDMAACRGFSANDKLKLTKAQAILDQVLPSKSFQSKVLAAQFKETNGLSNQEIYAKLMEDYTVRVVKISTWKWWSRVVAYVTGKGSTTVYYYAKFFNPNPAYEVASTLTHETAHLKGFSHRIKPWGASVPYMMNTIIEACAKEMGLDKL